MSETAQGSDWWQASDGRWYAPDLHPAYKAPQSIPDEPLPGRDATIPVEEDQAHFSVEADAATGGLTRTELVQDAIEKWRRQLIDLGGRNNLLYYKDRATATLDFSPDSGADEASVGRLVRSGKTRLAELFGLDRELLAAAAKRARGATKKAAENLEERGLSTLHLAWGLATWEGDRSTATPCAPILLCQVSLTPRGGAAEDFDITVEGEWSVNPTLLHALRTDFAVDIDPEGLDDLVTTAGERGDARPLFGLFAKLANDVPGFSISSRLVLSNFFYAYLAMVEDLAKSLDVMVASPLICAIVGDDEAREELRNRQLAAEFVDPDHIPPADEFLVLDADASQSYVINAAVAGSDLVVQGPPGTGKSQTIANLIATLSARGIRSLFVAEKRAAIDAVLKRLEGVGLGDLVLDLHDTSGTRSKVIADLDRALRSVGSIPLTDHTPAHQELTRRRSELVERSRALGEVRQPWGISASDIFTELPGFETLVRSDARIQSSYLTQMAQAELFEHQADIERFVLLKGIPLVQGISPWSSALRAGTVTSGDIVQSVRISAKHVRSQTLPDAGGRLQAVLTECGLHEPQTVEAWAELFMLLDGVANTLSVLDPTIFTFPLEGLLSELTPADSGLPTRAWSSATHPDYRKAKKSVLALWRGPKPNPKQIYEAVTLAHDQSSKWRAWSADGQPPRLPQDLGGTEDSYAQLSAELRAVGAVSALPGIEAQPIGNIVTQLDALLEDDETLGRLPELHRLHRSLSDAGLAEVVAYVAAHNLGAEQAAQCLRYVWLASVLESIESVDIQISAFEGDAHRLTVERFRRADTSHISDAPQRIKRLVAEKVTKARGDFPQESELLAKQARLKRKHMTIRQLRSEAPNVLAALKPCWAMSPLLVSQLLPAERCFDVCIFDEASQVTPAGAVGALIRAGQAIVAGDPHQLPPTAFFASTAEDSEEDEAIPTTSLVEGLESILDVMGALLPPPTGTKTLQWHYRSRDERLIAFSNAQESLYDWSLTTFPGTSVNDPISHVLVPFVAGAQEKTSSSTTEVRRVVELVAQHAREHPDESLGVIGFGSDHANRIEEAIRLARIQDPLLDEYLNAGPQGEMLFVKNLERVQGDERDAIIISVGYGKSADGRLYYRFGPINNAGGERRLNVAATRARRRMTVVSSFSAEEMDPTKLNSEGPRMLQRFLAYAESKGTDLGPHARPDVELNPFERDVQAQLTAAGIPLVPQYGASGYWIDFAAQHPMRPGQMVLAIETDGAAYHSSPTARNRDRLRQEHLERLGWSFHRIWSQEWFHHREREIERAVAAYRVAVDACDQPDGRVAGTSTPMSSELGDGGSGVLGTNVPERSVPMPVPRMLPITDYTDAQLVRLIRWIESDTLLRTPEELREAAIQALGYRRRGLRIVAALDAAIAAAHRVK